MEVVVDIEGYILAGGASSRMGRPKSELVLGSLSLLERAASTMSLLTRECVAVVGNEISSDACKTEFKTIKDLVSEPVERDHDRRAPIYGLFTALSVAGSEWIAVLAVDLPFVSGDLLALLASMRGEGTNAIVPVQIDGRLQPLCAIYRREVCLKAARMAIEGGELSLHKLLGALRVRRVEPYELADLQNADNFFLNVNTPQDLERARQIAEKSDCQISF